MIHILPYESETLVVVHEWDIVLEKLNAGLQAQPRHGAYALSGWIRDDRFQITLRARRFNQFMPLINGRIDPTSAGCLIFIEYSLYPGTRLHLAFWSIIFIIGGIVVSYQSDNYWSVFSGIGISVFLNLVAWGNFKLHLKTMREVFLKMIE